jgi:hypothetical protein
MAPRKTAKKRNAPPRGPKPSTRSNQAQAAQAQAREDEARELEELEREIRAVEAQKKEVAEKWKLLEEKEKEFEQKEAGLKQREAAAVFLDGGDTHIRKKARTDAGVDLYKEEIKMVVTEEVWRYIKFLPEKKSEQDWVFGVIVDGLAARYRSVRNKIAKKGGRELFISNHSTTMANCINDLRNGCINKTRLACNNYMSSTKIDDLPTVEHIKKCALRTIDLEDPAQLAAYKWYWTVLIPACCGSTKHWNNHVNLFSTISQANWPNPHKLGTEVIPASTEAFVVTVYDSCRKSWIEQRKLKKLHDGYTITHGKKGQPGAQNKLLTKNGRKMVKVTDPMYFAKYTDNTSGCNILGGWSDEGKGIYAGLERDIEASRKDDTCLALERTFYERLRRDLKVKGSSWKQHLRIKKREEAGLVVAEPLPDDQKPQVLSAAMLALMNGEAVQQNPHPEQDDQEAEESDDGDDGADDDQDESEVGSDGEEGSGDDEDED